MADTPHIRRDRAAQTPAAPGHRHAFASALAEVQETALRLKSIPDDKAAAFSAACKAHDAAMDRLADLSAPDVAGLKVKYETLLAYHRERDIEISASHWDCIAADLAQLAMNTQDAAWQHSATTARAAFPLLHGRSLSPAHDGAAGRPADVPAEDLKIMGAFERWCSLMLAEDPNEFEATPADEAIWEAQTRLAKEIMAMPVAGLHGQAIKTWLALRTWFGAPGRQNFAIDLPCPVNSDDLAGAGVIRALAAETVEASPYLAAALDEAAGLAVLRKAA